jgi:hypothetical protein
MSQPEETERIALYCVGCGQVATRARPGAVLAVACRCGANGPILYAEDGGAAVPFSLVMTTGNAPLPHLEYYLGFSGHWSELKAEAVRQLRALGAVSYRECLDAQCREAFERARARYLSQERGD